MAGHRSHACACRNPDTCGLCRTNCDVIVPVPPLNTFLHSNRSDLSASEASCCVRHAGISLLAKFDNTKLLCNGDNVDKLISVSDFVVFLTMFNDLASLNCCISVGK